MSMACCAVRHKKIHKTNKQTKNTLKNPKQQQKNLKTRIAIFMCFSTAEIKMSKSHFSHSSVFFLLTYAMQTGSNMLMKF